MDLLARHAARTDDHIPYRRSRCVQQAERGQIEPQDLIQKFRQFLRELRGVAGAQMRQPIG